MLTQVSIAQDARNLSKPNFFLPFCHAAAGQQPTGRQEPEYSATIFYRSVMLTQDSIAQDARNLSKPQLFF